MCTELLHQGLFVKLGGMIYKSEREKAKMEESSHNMPNYLQRIMLGGGSLSSLLTNQEFSRLIERGPSKVFRIFKI